MKNMAGRKERVICHSKHAVDVFLNRFALEMLTGFYQSYAKQQKVIPLLAQITQAERLDDFIRGSLDDL